MLRSGVDIIEIERIANAYKRRPQNFLRRFFTKREREHLATRKHIEQHLAVRFAGKEAVFKMLGLGLGDLSWQEVEIIRLPSGQPHVLLYGKAKNRAEELDIKEIAISLSHSRDYAVAQAICI